MTFENEQNDVKVTPSSAQLIYTSVLPDIILAVAIALGWYVRYNFYENLTILYAGGLGILLIGSNLCLKYYFSVRFSHILFNVWSGCLLSVLAIYDINELTDSRQSNIEEIVHILLLSTITCDVVCCVVQKCCMLRGSVSHSRDYHLGTHAQIYLAIGVCIGFLLSDHNPLPYLSLILAILCCVVALHMQNTPSFFILIFLIFVADRYVIPLTRASINPYAMLVIVARLTINPIIDLVWPYRTKFDRWRPFMTQSRCVHLLILMGVILIEAAFLTTHALVISKHKEWFIVVPLFACAACLYVVLHLAAFGVYSSLTHKFRQTFIHSTSTIIGASAKTALGATGLRHFALLAVRLSYACLTMTLLIGALCWTTPSQYTHSFLVSVICLELVFLDLLRLLATTVGGTCIGYAVVAPILSTRNDGLVTLVSPTAAETSSTQSARQLQTVISFFQTNLITNYGADWSMKGMSDMDLVTRLEDFFAQTSSAGLRYDTYLLYFSGPTIEETGDWALAQGTQLSLKRVLSHWEACNVNRSSRLLLIVDSAHAHKWLKGVFNINMHAVALQTFYHKPTRKVAGENFQDGTVCDSFTQLWTQTSTDDQTISLTTESLRERYRPTYAVSTAWNRFEFHQPSTSDFNDYSSKVVPHILQCCCLQPVLLCMSIQPTAGLAAISPCCSRTLTTIQTIITRWHMKIWPPQRLDTQHGFYLIM